MESDKVKMYVSVQSQQVYPHKYASPWEYEVEMSREFLPIFEQIFREMDRLEFRNFLRAHLPYVPYHYDKNNHEVDDKTMKIYALIHEFSDEETKKFIEGLPYFTRPALP
ncbi:MULTISPECIES: transposase [Sporosarcina]|uniref:Transposase n=1 Tax=Sporosarcina saromensis TaxID=359365 RepID=A0ABU4GDC8_9BACL|nr:transposase [Sporosarcina saromensis]MDW0114990.1 transposase [Sporosarcina saromensis]